MEDIPINKLKKGVDYHIEVIGGVDSPTYRGVTRGKYLGNSFNEYIESSEDDDEYIETNDMDDGPSQELFVINKYFPDNGIKSFRYNKYTELLNFIRPVNFNKWGNNITIDNVSHFTHARKWRPSRDRNIEIPIDIAKEYLKFYELVSSQKKSIKSVIKAKLNLDEDTTDLLSDKIASGGVARRPKTRRRHKTRRRPKTMRRRKTNKK